MGPFKSYIISVLVSSIILIGLPSARTQRSLHHWKRDLEHRLQIYQDHRNVISDIISSSVYPTRGDQLIKGPVKISSRGNVRFSDLIIPAGSLRLGPSIAPSAVRILAAKTQAYVTSRSDELFAIESQLDEIRRQLNDPSNQFVYKGLKSAPQPRHNYTRVIRGSRVFKQAQYAHLVESPVITVKQINNTNVDRVIDDTYLRNTKFAVRDSKGRPYFEGRKTFWNTVFTKELESGCCGRLQPIDTSRVMLRSIDQDVQAPILIQTGSSSTIKFANPPPALVRQLSTRQFYNRRIALNPRLSTTRLANGDIGLLPSPPPENFIQLTNLINTRQLDQAEILKTLVFKSAVVIDEVQLSNSYADSRLVIGISSMPGFYFDLSHDNYLLRYFAHHNRNDTLQMQRVSGALILNGPTSFLGQVGASTVNNIGNFAQFLRDSLVYINRPSIIQGPIQFNALPAMLDPRQGLGSQRSPSGMNQAGMTSRQPQNVLIMHVKQRLEVGIVNGMRWPQDIVILASQNASPEQNYRLSLKPNQPVRVRGPRHFANRVVFKDFLNVNGTINEIPMPSGVIPLHLNDFINTAGYSNLWFLDGIDTFYLTTHSNQFDSVNLNDVNGDAQSLVMKSMLLEQPDGSLLIRAPLKVLNLNLIQGGPNQGLLNGFRPQEVLELNPRYPYDTIYGRKTFLAPVEAIDCVFSDINQVANWTNHLIRIDRPNTVQTIHTKLAFTSPTSSAPSYGNNSVPPTVVNIDRVNVEFYPDNHPDNYKKNWNFSPEFYLMQQALMRNLANSTGGRYRVNHVRLIDPRGGLVNQIPLNDIVTLDKPFRFAGRFTMVGKVEVATRLQAGIINSNYPIDVMDLAQFDRYRIPIIGNSRGPIKLDNLVLGEGNRASFTNCKFLNGMTFSTFASSIMSLTKPQDVYSTPIFSSPVSFDGFVRIGSSLNGVKNFGQFARNLKMARYSFEEGMQVNSVVVKT